MRGKRLLKKRGEVLERPFAHMYETGGMRRMHLRGRDNVTKKTLLQAAAFNVSMAMRQELKVGTPRGLQGWKGQFWGFVVAMLAWAGPRRAGTQPTATARKPVTEPRA